MQNGLESAGDEADRKGDGRCMTTTSDAVRGPYFDELASGTTSTPMRRQSPSPRACSPPTTPSSAAGYGCRWTAVSRAPWPVAPWRHAALVWDVAIGQSTVVTQHVRANLFYRGLRFHRQPFLGDTLHTVTTGGCPEGEPPPVRTASRRGWPCCTS